MPDFFWRAVGAGLCNKEIAQPLAAAPMSVLRGINDSVSRSFVVFWKTIKSVYEDLFNFVWLSILWWVGTITVVLAPAVHMGLNHVAYRVSTYKRIDNDFFFFGARQYKKESYLVYLLNCLASVVLLVCIWFYLNVTLIWVNLVAIPLLWIAVFFLLLTQFLFPLLWEQEERSLQLAYKNAMILVLRYPFFCILVFVLKVTVLVLFSIPAFIPLFLFGPAFSTVLSNYALNYLLQDMGLAPPPPEYAT